MSVFVLSTAASPLVVELWLRRSPTVFVPIGAGGVTLVTSLSMNFSIPASPSFFRKLLVMLMTTASIGISARRVRDARAEARIGHPLVTSCAIPAPKNEQTTPFRALFFPAVQRPFIQQGLGIRAKPLEPGKLFGHRI